MFVTYIVTKTNLTFEYKFSKFVSFSLLTGLDVVLTSCVDNNGILFGIIERRCNSIIYVRIMKHIDPFTRSESRTNYLQTSIIIESLINNHKKMPFIHE